MALAWFLAPYKTHPTRLNTRYVSVDDLTPVIHGEGGGWTETEVLGQHAIVKVRATPATLALVAALPGVTRFPVDRLDDPLSSLSGGQKSALRNLVTSLGYSLSDFRDRFPGDLGDYTLRDVVGFAASRRRKPRWDEATQTIIDDGPDQPVRPVAEVDAEIT